MTIEYIRYRIPRYMKDSFISDYKAAAESLKKSNYCLGYELSQCEEEPERFILRIEWTSTADHLQKFRTSEEFQHFLPLVKPYIDNIEEMQHYASTKIIYKR